MFCRNCGNNLPNNAKFCNKCGTAVVNTPNQSIEQISQPVVQNNKKTISNNTNIKSILTKAIPIVAVFIIVYFAVNFITGAALNTRTIMIYMAGNNLESDGGIATADIKSILPTRVDITKTKVLLYTGGTKKWQNDFIDSNENAIYELTENGFQKVETYSKKNVGDARQLTTFLDYAYKNYKSKKYDLIFWDHGAASLGAIIDENSEDLLYLYEISNGLKNSTLIQNEKLETVIFRTCLNGNIEMANTIAPYAKYLVASEEITYGYKTTSVLNFINNLNPKDDGIEVGKQFISAYEKQMKELDSNQELISTYSLLDLSKMEELNNAMDNFFSNINIDDYYRLLSKTRNSLYQYALEEEAGYDTVDLYNLIDNIKEISPEKAKKITKILDDLVIQNWTLNTDSKGLSIYFPYNGATVIQNAHFAVYDKIDFSRNYYEFIRQFSNKRIAMSSLANSTLTNKVNVTKNKISLVLTKEQQEDFANANYILYEKTSDNTYNPIYTSKMIYTPKDGILKSEITSNLLSVIKESTKEEQYVNMTELNNGKYSVPVILTGNENKTIEALIKLSINDSTPEIYQVTKINDIAPNGQMIHIEDYNKINFTRDAYTIENSELVYQTNWLQTKQILNNEISTDDYTFEISNLNPGKEYYCQYKLKDIYGNEYYSQIVKVE